MIGRLADAIFASLMKEFHIQADVPHHLFVTALWRSLLLASLAAGGVGVLLSVVLFGQVIRPVRGMMAMAGRVAGGDYGARAAGASSAELESLAESLNRMAGALAGFERRREGLCAHGGDGVPAPPTELRGLLLAAPAGGPPRAR